MGKKLSLIQTRGDRFGYEGTREAQYIEVQGFNIALQFNLKGECRNPTEYLNHMRVLVEGLEDGDPPVVEAVRSGLQRSRQGRSMDEAELMRLQEAFLLDVRAQLFGFAEALMEREINMARSAVYYRTDHLPTDQQRVTRIVDAFSLAHPEGLTDDIAIGSLARLIQVYPRYQQYCVQAIREAQARVNRRREAREAQKQEVT